jgi:hypothetical protein
MKPKSLTNGENGKVLLPFNSRTCDLNSFWEIMDTLDSPTEKQALIQQYLVYIIQLSSSNFDLEILPDTDFVDIGIHSQQMLKLKSALDTMLGDRCSIGIIDLIGNRTLATFTLKVWEMIDTEVTADVKEAKKKTILKKLMQEDSLLWPHIQTKELPPPVPIPQVKTILLTGATGQLAPYILEQFIKQDQIRKVYCLVRDGGGSVTPKDRLIKNLKAIDLLDRIDMDKVFHDLILKLYDL